MTLSKKVFCIGLNRTGTTTCGAAFRELGLKLWGWNSHSAEFTLRWHEGNFSQEMMNAVQNHDAFTDIPWCMLYQELDRIFPESVFVLTKRKSVEIWLRSIQKHIAKSPNWVGHYLIYGSYDPVEDAEFYIQKYNSHNENVEKYFSSRPEKLITLCWERGHAWYELCNFLNLPVPDIAFPHMNKQV